MAGCKHEAEEVVAYLIIEDRLEIRGGPLLCGFELVAELLQLAPEPLPPAEQIDRTMLRGAHQPGPWVARDARVRPLLERRDESVLCEVLGQTDVAHDACDTRDQLRRLDPPHRIDRAMRIGSGHPDHLTSLIPATARLGLDQLPALGPLPAL